MADKVTRVKVPLHKIRISKSIEFNARRDIRDQKNTLKNYKLA